MLIHYGVYVLGVNLSHVGVELPSGFACTTCGDDGDLRMLLLYGFVHYVEALPELLSSVLVSNAHIFEVERLRVAHLGAQRTPLCINAAVAELDEVYGILDEYAVEAVAVLLGLKRSLVPLASELAGNAIVEDWQSLSAK